MIVPHNQTTYWRREGDSNPRAACTAICFRGSPVRPLWHPSVSARRVRESNPRWVGLAPNRRVSKPPTLPLGERAVPGRRAALAGFQPQESGPFSSPTSFQQIRDAFVVSAEESVSAFGGANERILMLDIAGQVRYQGRFLDKWTTLFMNSENDSINVQRSTGLGENLTSPVYRRPSLNRLRPLAACETVTRLRPSGGRRFTGNKCAHFAQLCLKLVHFGTQLRQACLFFSDGFYQIHLRDQQYNTHA
jgi:hypothetical protein